jgi:hypothetical protein
LLRLLDNLKKKSLNRNEDVTFFPFEFRLSELTGILQGDTIRV